MARSLAYVSDAHARAIAAWNPARQDNRCDDTEMKDQDSHVHD
jgi:hypothetical protein